MTRRRVRCGRVAAIALCAGLACAFAQPPEAVAASVSARVARANSPSRLAHQSRASTRAPGGPPLLSSSGVGSTETAESAGAQSPAGEVDPLVSNGLGSPSCRSGVAGELSATPRRNCETSGFVGAAAPTGNYGIDVHIDTGVLGLSSGGLLSTVQDLLVTPIWMAHVWVVHALIVMLEWCFALDLLDGASGLAGGLASAQRYLTSPWLPVALSVAGVLLAYEGLVRRRVAESLGQALLVLLMIGGGLWVMLNPSGTVGALSGWTNQAGLGTLAVAARGTPVAPGEALGAGMEGLFSATVEGPWCYLEFGDVRWCREPSMLDPRLKEAGLKIAKEELSQSGCQTTAVCSAPVEESARLLREARTNGALFLALPSNGPARNSINSQTSLLHTLCGSEEATNCSASTAAEAEFRTNAGTWSRVGGLLLISIGVLGMVLLLGSIGLHLLMAAMLSLFYLLLAPGVVLAPAFGERGRAFFRGWVARLFGAVVSKLVFAFLLGVVLAVMAIIGSLNGLGWWTQWLLLAAFWWGVFLRRNQLLAGASGVIAERRERRSIGRRAAQIVERPLRRRLGENVVRRRGDPPPRAKPGPMTRARGTPASTASDLQAISLLANERSSARRGERVTRPGEDEKRAQLERITRAQVQAGATGDKRRAAQLAVRRDRVAASLEPSDSSDATGGPTAAHDARPASTSEHGRFLDGQAQLPARGARDDAGRRRDYSALAPLAGLARSEYEALRPPSQRMARVEIDRELAARREGRTAESRSALPAGACSTPTPVGSEEAVYRPTRRPPEVTRAGAEELPESEVWRDIKEVEAGRKRQLGIGWP